jgi:hypothetical protein
MRRVRRPYLQCLVSTRFSDWNHHARHPTAFPGHPARQGRNPGPGAALHPQVPRQDHGHQVRRQCDDRSGVAG